MDRLLQGNPERPDETLEKKIEELLHQVADQFQIEQHAMSYSSILNNDHGQKQDDLDERILNLKSNIYN